MNAQPTLDQFPFDPAVRFTDRDDQMHPWGTSPDWVETLWFSFYSVERSLGGWLYVQVRPNLGTASGGAFVYQPGACLPWELPFYAFFNHQPLPVPAEELNLADVTFRNGVSVKVVEPGMVYELGYRFRDQSDFVADLRFEGLTPPVPHLQGAPPFVGSSHYDQHGRVTGSLELHGEHIEIDCFAVRDRSWGRRPEHVGLAARRLSYAFGTFGADDAFLVFCMPPAQEQESEVEQLSTGYLLRDGQLRRLEQAERRNVRDPATGGIERVDIEMTDTDGRALSVRGTAVSRMFLNAGGLCINTMLRYQSDSHDQVAWGEDQDVFSLARFASMRLTR
ncbi:MAG: hypothetical protein JWL70_1058 [Acidimicrobiia bacterium]|nr:hypothetical protein [Acidimicrobiia bacterium]